MPVQATVATELMVPSLRLLSSMGRQVERLAQDTGVEILQAHGLPIESFSNLSERIPHATAVALLENAIRVSGIPEFALHAGRAIERGELGVYDLLASSAATLGESMRLAARYLPLIHDGAVIELEVSDNELIWKHRLLPGAQQSAAVNEYVLASFHAGAQRSLGFEAPPIEIWMMHQQPSHHAEYAKIFKAPVRFGCTHNAIVSPRVALELPLASSDPAVLKVLTRYADELMPRVPYSEPFVQRVREQVQARLQHDSQLTAVARALHMSESSLQRRLQSANTSYTEVVDDVRRECALRLLADAELNISEIAFQLGFAHRTAFHRAFSRWFGYSPTEHRARQGHSEFYRFYRGSGT